MKVKFEFTILVTVLLSIMFLSNYFIFTSFFTLFSFQKGFIYWTLIVFSSLFYLTASNLEKMHFNSITKSIYIASAVWMGISFLALSYISVFALLSIFITFQKEIAGFVLLSLILITSIYSLINANSLKINKINLYFDKKILENEIKLVHLSDIHIGTINTQNYLQKIVNKVNSLNPDLVMLTGDLIDGSAPITSEMLKPLNDLKVPVYFVIGNHEIYDGLDLVLPILKKTKLIILRNEVVKWKGIEIAGIDFYQEKNRSAIEIKKLNVSKNQFKILLNHPPTAFDTAVSKGFNLQLSGHTHFGQIFPFTLLVKLSYKKINGIYKKQGSFLFVSAGTGTWGPPMRLFSKSEIALINLKMK
ncbi:MAG: metallophosphoesterase [Nanoarchaeota archaeon]|nr:metallophosphoesterase [Nanoarchaeota archaeon]